MKELRELIDSYKDCLTDKEREYICDFDWSTSQFYILPKIHKSQSIISAITDQDSLMINIKDPMDLKGRPIVACCNSPI